MIFGRFQEASRRPLREQVTDRLSADYYKTGAVTDVLVKSDYIREQKASFFVSYPFRTALLGSEWRICDPLCLKGMLWQANGRFTRSTFASREEFSPVGCACGMAIPPGHGETRFYPQGTVSPKMIRFYSRLRREASVLTRRYSGKMFLSLGFAQE